MNKIIISTVLACGLLLLNVPEAAAHEARHSEHRSTRHDTHARHSFRRDGYRHDYRPDYYGSRYERAHRMPRWLKRNRSFRHWFKHTRLTRNRYLSWYELFDIYRWEHSGYRYGRH